MPPAQKMNVQMENSLATVIVSIYHCPIALFRKPALTCNASSSQKKVAQNIFMFAACRSQRCKMFAGDDQDMGRRLRMDVLKRIANFVFENFLRRYITCNYLAEKTIILTHKERILNHKLVFYKTLFVFLSRHCHVIRDAFNIRTNRTQLFNDIFVTTVDVINTIDQRFSLRRHPGQNQ